MQEARAVGERTKALEMSKAKAAAAKVPVKKAEQRRTKRELFCEENLQEIEDSLLGQDEPFPADENTVEDGRTAAAPGAVDEVGSAVLDDAVLEDENAESFMEE